MAIFSFKGASGEGQGNFLSNLFEKYIEETTSFTIELTQAQLADINSLSINNYSGQGGPESPIPEMDFNPGAIQQSSIVQYSAPDFDLSKLSSAKKIKRGQTLNYVVQKGDTLSFIASDFGVSVNTIIWANNLRNADSLKLGQELKIPPVSGVIYIVKKGDTLASISKRYSGEINEIIAFNGLPKDETLKIGQEIIIPNGKIPNQYASGTQKYVKSSIFSYLPNLNEYFLIPAAGFNWRRVHGRNGVDISNTCGTPIFSAAEGNIVIADAKGWNGGFGKFIKIKHSNNTETVYAHSSKLLVNQGEFVGQGQMIALMGSTGKSTGCHLHFEVHGARNPLARY